MAMEYLDPKTFDIEMLHLIRYRGQLRGGPNHRPQERFTLTQAFVMLDEAFDSRGITFDLPEPHFSDPTIPYCSNDCGSMLTITDYGTVCRQCRLGGGPNLHSRDRG